MQNNNSTEVGAPVLFLLLLLCLCGEVEGDYGGKHGHEQFCRNNSHDAQVAEYQAQQDGDDGFYSDFLSG